MEEHRNFVERLVQKGGPDENDYSDFDTWLARLHPLASDGTVSPPELTAIRSMFGAALSPATMQGFALAKPHGYAGDYEVIDRIYQQYISPDPHLANWDRYYHHQAAPQAVRNRKHYFHKLLDHHASRQPLRVLNIASGPGRCMFEWLSGIKRSGSLG
ncbi:MAG: hypothetical protein FJ387_18190 [Verrucomicrobia bacterium]|nr:hypothetical protein [Verrucomicrobiota bacterium]